MIKRLFSQKLNHYLKLFPIVSVIGPRQAGKTTFIKKELFSWKYFDLEKPSDFRRIESDMEYFFNEYGNQCIIDEAQNMPVLFPFLRSFVDTNRKKKGRIVLLGSINPLLMKNISESLSGRIGFVEIPTFLFSEISKKLKLNLESFWLKGGYPEPIKWKTEDHIIWLESYIKTFTERDVFRYNQIDITAQKQIQLLTMIAHTHGKLWNASQISSAFGTSYHTINNYIDILNKYFIVRRLMPYFANVGKRLMKHPKIYFRDAGILHYLLGIDSLEMLRTSPYRGFSFEGLIIENIIQNLDAVPNARNEYYFYRTAQGDEIDLLVKTGSKLTAFEIKTSSSVGISDLSGFQRCMQHLKIEKGIVIYMGKEDFSLTSNIEVKSAWKYLINPA
ncbi:MAG: ATP-binding protein [Elusimicrobia bacterium]|nr:ATP-binding protein [Candidatus Liberimonas magnetica]